MKHISLKRALSSLLATAVALTCTLCFNGYESTSVQASTLTYDTNEEYIFNFLTTEMGLNTAAACGVLANIEKESNFRSDLMEIGYTWASGGGYGICQWTNYPRTSGVGRRTNLVNYCYANGYDYTSLLGQLYYLKYELEHTYYNTVYSKLRAVSNTADGAYTAGYRWCYSFEIPRNYASVSITRGNIAKNKYWTKYKDYTNCECSTAFNGDYVVDADDGGVVLAAGHSLDAYQVATVSNGEAVTLIKSDGVWAHISWNGYTGICRLDDIRMVEDDGRCFGDINGDKALTSTDVIMLKKYIMQQINFTETMLNAADVNGDGMVDIMDYMVIVHVLCVL